MGRPTNPDVLGVEPHGVAGEDHLAQRKFFWIVHHIVSAAKLVQAGEAGEAGE
jgi:hypothetical protein